MECVPILCTKKITANRITIGANGKVIRFMEKIKSAFIESEIFDFVIVYTKRILKLWLIIKLNMSQKCVMVFENA